LAEEKAFDREGREGSAAKDANKSKVKIEIRIPPTSEFSGDKPHFAYADAQGRVPSTSLRAGSSLRLKNG
jgi:hypothetical protein